MIVYTPCAPRTASDCLTKVPNFEVGVLSVLTALEPRLVITPLTFGEEGMGAMGTNVDDVVMGVPVSLGPWETMGHLDPDDCCLEVIELVAAGHNVLTVDFDGSGEDWCSVLREHDIDTFRMEMDEFGQPSLVRVPA